ncbi:peptide chain release factor N(5)-glutamine methyltransferase [Gemella haemolysans]|jgi:protein-(glutamine-N5) methyltransferase, release factor-specific|uniref:Release factor glutamine methyltransferase n=2 Tax=Gemella haemolysans TaxID=1379 RepID=A0AA87B9K1_9BACL|nr:peptide chain release factor N(5)-glutamine methyltransferase [Gemella haemolysans]EGF87302.1 protein-(glutamine-N5) methyltransferase [Gemella haemolysans M341]QIX87961.1 peptide chain release factor N(5)-glutamine methyltransferase [Gemella haemolysans]
MNRRQAITKACLLLRRQGKEESLARFLLMYMLDENSQQFTNNISEQISKEKEELYFSLIDKHIEENMPLSHLAGFEYFYDRKFKVTKDVLSPRMETEELIYKVIEYIKSINKNNIKILDLCTGSGIIGITLRKELESKSLKVVASDISEEALKVAKENAIMNEAEVKFIQSDIFENINEKFDIIVSNPPYIAYSDKITMEDNVLNYDPHLALFAEEDGMYFYREIVENSKEYLNKDGMIFFEIGYDQREKILKLANENEFKAEVYKDINGRDRMAILERI